MGQKKGVHQRENGPEGQARGGGTRIRPGQKGNRQRGVELGIKNPGTWREGRGKLKGKKQGGTSKGPERNGGDSTKTRKKLWKEVGYFPGKGVSDRLGGVKPDYPHK